MNKATIDMIYQVGVAAAEKALVNAGLKKATLTCSEAKDLYGEYKIRKWTDLGYITPIKQGDSKNSQVNYSIEELHKAELYSSSRSNRFFKK